VQYLLPTEASRCFPGRTDDAFGKVVLADGALSAKVGQIIAVTVAQVTQCPYCIKRHTKAASRAGATPQELMEAIWMAAEMHAGAAYAGSMRWVHHDAPAFERRWNRFARPAGSSWRVDETDVKIRGRWVYLSRAVDREGNTVDFRLSIKRDVAAAKAFVREAIKSQGSTPRTITLDGYAASHRAVREMTADGQLPADTKLHSSRYLNNLIEQDHRSTKRRIGPMLGLKWFKTAAVTIAGLELLRRIHKGQFNHTRLRLKDRRTPAVWDAVLAAR
jgi:transposase, IS6 family